MITLRKYRLEDAEQLASYIGNEEVLINLSDWVPNPYTVNDAEGFISNVIKNNDFRFAIEYNGQYCGGIGLDKITGNCAHYKAREIGYWIAKPFWNNGIATSAITKICNMGFEELSLVRIEANVYSYNMTSMHVLEKCGFEREGIQRKGAVKNGNIVDSHRFAMVK